jgi:hypothetical protein
MNAKLFQQIVVDGFGIGDGLSSHLDPLAQPGNLRLEGIALMNEGAEFN